MAWGRAWPAAIAVLYFLGCGGGVPPGPPQSPGPDQTVPQCMPTTCAAAGATCGTIPDGCGHMLSCGECSSGPALGDPRWVVTLP